MSENKKKYSVLLQKEKSIPLFSRNYWLSAVCGEENWDVILVEKGNEIVAFMPYYIERKFSKKLLTMPKLTQSLGPWIKYPEGQKEHTRLSYEKEIFTSLIDQLPQYEYFKQNFHYSITNWLPFYWKGFSQLSKYTYIIENLSDLDSVYEGVRGNIKRQIKKAEKIISCTETDDIKSFYEFSLETKNKPSFSLEFLTKLDTSLRINNARKILTARDSEGNTHASIYIVYDEERVYYLMGNTNPEYKSSGATSLLMWEAIKFASSFANVFDFEGSMIEPIERFFNSFGAIQKPYFRISKVNSNLLKLAFAAKGLLK